MGRCSPQKFSDEELTDRPEVIANFRREATHAARLGDHPNAIPILDSGDQEGLFFLLMPFVEGEDLDHLLRDHGPLNARGSAPLRRADQQPVVPCRIARDYALRCLSWQRSSGHLWTVPVDGFRHFARCGRRSGHAAGGHAAVYQSRTDSRRDPGHSGGHLWSRAGDLRGAYGQAAPERPPALPTSGSNISAGIGSFRRLWRPTKLSRGCFAGCWPREREERFGSAFELSGALEALGFARPEFRPRTSGVRAYAPSTRRSRLS